MAASRISTNGPIFTREDGEPFVFLIKGERASFADLIVQNGGAAPYQRVEEDYAVTLCEARAIVKFPSGKDVFDAQYIIDCSDQQKLLPLRNYRLNKNSLFEQDYDPLDILNGIISWSDLTLKKDLEPEGEACSLFDSDDIAIPANQEERQKVKKMPPRMPYSIREEEAIIKYLIDKKAYNHIKGTKLWKEMEQDLSNGRTWQSMKERFLKATQKRLHRFNVVEQKHLDKFNMALKGQMVESSSESSSSSPERKSSSDKEQSPMQHRKSPKKPRDKSPQPGPSRVLTPFERMWQKKRQKSAQSGSRASNVKDNITQKSDDSDEIELQESPSLLSTGRQFFLVEFGSL